VATHKWGNKLANAAQPHSIELISASQHTQTDRAGEAPHPALHSRRAQLLT
jgi:hypothetical protein